MTTLASMPCRPLRRVLGPAEALPCVEEVERARPGTVLGEQAAREARKLRKALAQ